MEQERKLVPGVQIQDEEKLAEALKHLDSLGIDAQAAAIAELATDAMPHWADPDAGGWFLLIHEDGFEEGMAAVSKLMGYEPD